MKLLKTIFICFLILGMFSQVVSKLIVMISFEMNKEFIVKNLCEQKEEVDNCCQGSCHLKKELEKQDEQDASTNNQQKVKLEQDQCYYGLFLFASKLSIENEIETPNNPYQLADYSASVFQPPETIC